MAILHQATISPTKDELIVPWLRTRTWWDGVDERGPVGTFRLDDPAGEVGMECFLFGSSEGSTLFVPVTYRGAELPGAERHLIGTMEHSVLGHRWVYDACADPVFVATVVETIRTAGRQADLEVHRRDGTVTGREHTARVRGSGGADVPAADPDTEVEPVDHDDHTIVTAGDLSLHVVRRIGADLAAGPNLVGDFAGGDGLVLATVSWA